jgi:hypothetical protein
VKEILIFFGSILGTIVLLSLLLTSHDEQIIITQEIMPGIHIGGYHEWCYQEYAQVPTSCGGLGTGLYREDGNFTNDTYYFRDGDWLTGGFALNDSYMYYYITYSKPEYAKYNTKWQVGYSNGTHNYTTNLTINQSCFDRYSDKILLRVAMRNTTSPRLQWQCFNSAWINISTNTTMTQFYEEAIWWNLSKDVNITQNLQIKFIPQHPYSKNVSILAQNITTPLYNLTNLVNIQKNITIRKNKDINNIDIFCDTVFDNECSNESIIILNTTAQIIKFCNGSNTLTYSIFNLSSAPLYCWANFSNPSPRQQSFSIIIEEVD